MIPDGKPRLTIVFVGDYGGGTEKGWQDLRKSLGGMRAELERVGGPAGIEILLVEQDRYVASAPASLRQAPDGLTLLGTDATSSYGMKNAGVAAAAADWVVLIDGDCTPRPGWLAAVLRAIDRHPEAAAISGRTLYEGRTVDERISALLSRAYLDVVREGRTRFVSNNNAVWRKSWFTRYPMPTGLGAFSSRLQSEQMLRAGAEFWFDPAIVVIHEFEGDAMEADIRRNVGYGTVISRLSDPQMPYARLVRLGPAAIPLIVAGKAWLACGDILRCSKAYDVPWWALPRAFAAALRGGLQEIPGMLRAYRGQGVGRTAYR